MYKFKPLSYNNNNRILLPYASCLLTLFSNLFKFILILYTKKFPFLNSFVYRFDHKFYDVYMPCIL